MRFISPLIAAATLATQMPRLAAANGDQLSKEDKLYWDRIMLETVDSFAAPTASPIAPIPAPIAPVPPPVTPTAPVVPPVGPPTLTPTPRPVEATSTPTLSPTTSVTCAVEVLIACFTDNNIPCDQITIPSDEIDCNTVIQYSYQVTNLNTVDVIDILGLMRVRNDEPADFTRDAMAANPLGPGDIIVIREETTIDVCLEASIETTAVVAAEVPGGIPCMDEDVNRFMTGVSGGGVITPTTSPSPTITPSPTTTPFPTVTPSPTSTPGSSFAPFLPSFPPFSLTSSPTSTGVDPLPTPTTPAPVGAPTGPSTKSPAGPSTKSPTQNQTGSPTQSFTGIPTDTPSTSPTKTPTTSPTVAPVIASEAPSIAGVDGLPTPGGLPSETSSPTVSSPSMPAGVTDSDPPTGVDPLPTPPSPGNPTISPAPTVSPEPTVSPAPTVSPEPTISLAPTVSPEPTISPAPTVSPEPTVTAAPSESSEPTTTAAPAAAVPTIVSDPPSGAFCSISAVVSCEGEDGEPCEFVNPVGQQCIGERAKELRFIYQSDSFCQGNNTQNNYICLDENPDLPRPSTVFIRFYFGDETYYEGVVSSGNIIPVPISGSSNGVVVEISNLNEDNTPNLLLQSMLLSVQCREQDALILYDTFGSLQLTGYRNEELGLNSIFTTVTIRNTATNVGTEGAVLNGAFKTNPITGMVPLLPDGATVGLDPGQSQSFSDVFTLNLGTLVGMPIEFSFLTSGTDVDTGVECGDSDTYTLLVSP